MSLIRPANDEVWLARGARKQALSFKRALSRDAAP
jgi:hypothetical protein